MTNLPLKSHIFEHIYKLSTSNDLKNMSIKIGYSNKTENKSQSNLILFTNDKFNISGLKKNITNHEFAYINDLLKTSDRSEERV